MSKWKLEPDEPDGNVWGYDYDADDDDIWSPSPAIRFLQNLIVYFLLILAGLGGIILSFYLITWLWGYLMYLFSEMARLLNPPKIKRGQGLGLGLDFLKPKLPEVDPKLMILPDYRIRMPKVILEDPIRIQPKLDFLEDPKSILDQLELDLIEVDSKLEIIDSDMETRRREMAVYREERMQELIDRIQAASSEFEAEELKHKQKEKN